MKIIDNLHCFPKIDERLLQKAPILATLTTAEVNALLPFCELLTFKAGQSIVQKGEIADSIFIFAKGKITANKKELSLFTAIGDYVLMSGDEYEETVVAVEESEMIRVNLQALSYFLNDRVETRQKIFTNIINHTHFSTKHKTQLQRSLIKNLFLEMDYRLKISIFTIYTLSLLSIYNLFVEFFDVSKKSALSIDSSLISTIEILSFAVVFIIMIRHFKIPFSEFGFNLRRWKRFTLESLGWTFLFCIGLTLVKWGVRDYFPFIKEQPLISFNYKDTFHAVLFICLYALMAPVQEFIFQGAIQGSLMKLLQLKYTVAVSVAVSTVVFAAAHIDLHFTFAIAILPANLLWALMYARQKSLLGVSISHAIIGVWGFYFLNISVIFFTFDKMLFG